MKRYTFSNKMALSGTIAAAAYVDTPLLPGMREVRIWRLWVVNDSGYWCIEAWSEGRPLPALPVLRGPFSDTVSQGALSCMRGATWRLVDGPINGVWVSFTPGGSSPPPPPDGYAPLPPQS